MHYIFLSITNDFTPFTPVSFRKMGSESRVQVQGSPQNPDVSSHYKSINGSAYTNPSLVPSSIVVSVGKRNMPSPYNLDS